MYFTQGRLSGRERRFHASMQVSANWIWRLVVIAFVVWGAVEEVQGTPQAARWLGAAGVKHGQLVGLLITGALMLIALLLLAGPERIRGWFKSKPAEPLVSTRFM